MVKKRDLKREWETEHKRQQDDPKKLFAKLERQRARRKADKEGVDRAGKDIAHVKALSRGGTSKDGTFLASPSENRSFARRSDHKPKAVFDRPKRTTK